DEEQMKKLWNRTLNARGETIFDKPSFRSAARHSRCIIYVDGFYEHHHYKGKTYPFFIFAKDQRPLALAGLYSEWKNPETNGHFLTFSIVTSIGNLMMKRIHNNPKLSEPRMPFILSSEYEDKWLKEAEDDVDLQAIQEMIQEFPEEELKAYTVGKLRGKEYIGNIKTISDEVHYPDLVLE
ncbi:MAG: SOS response-associated peptidase, partial [Flavobacteriaceae bacterium]|nr:SOS response-associated peptidase [Flavobacteriaceae bacterium]